jgi:hypothetical protein
VVVGGERGSGPHCDGAKHDDVSRCRGESLDIANLLCRITSTRGFHGADCGLQSGVLVDLAQFAVAKAYSFSDVERTSAKTTPPRDITQGAVTHVGICCRVCAV